jgi:hypothetical protein
MYLYFISIFQTFKYTSFHLYVATIQQHLYMGYISNSWYNIPDLKLSIKIVLTGLPHTSKIQNQWFLIVKNTYRLQSFATITNATYLTITESLPHRYVEPSWSWSHGSWIYNYFCNQFNLNIFYCLNNDKRIRHKFFNLVLTSPYTYNIQNTIW